MAGSPPNFHKMDIRSAFIQGVVKVKGHVIWALLCWHENRFFSHANGRIATKLAHDGLQVSLHPGYAQGHGQRSCDTHTFLDSWNELLRHWRSASRFHCCGHHSIGPSACDCVCMSLSSSCICFPLHVYLCVSVYIEVCWQYSTICRSWHTVACGGVQSVDGSWIHPAGLSADAAAQRCV